MKYSCNAPPGGQNKNRPMKKKTAMPKKMGKKK